MPAIITATARETTGRVTYLRPDSPLAGVTSLTTFTDDATSGYVKTFRYSTDGVRFSDWISLTNPNLALVTFDDIFVIELAYDSTDIVGSYSVTTAIINGTVTTLTNGPIFNQSIFAKFFTEYDPDVIGWYVNVVQKIYGGGLIANYIEQQDINGAEDSFIAFWSAVAKYFAYFVIYARKFQNFFNDFDLLGEYLQERGLCVSINDTLAFRQDLTRNYYGEMFKRGTIHIIDNLSDIITSFGGSSTGEFGELLRLVYYSHTDEFLFNLYKPENFGWNLGNSSPLYRGIASVNQNVNKARSLSQAWSTVTGLQYFQVFENYVKVDHRLGYEVNFILQDLASSPAASIKVEVIACDITGSIISMLSAYDGSSTNIFINNYYPVRYDVGLFYRFIIYPYNTAPSIRDVTNLNVGHNLIFPENVAAVKVKITVYSPGTPGPLPYTVGGGMKMFPIVTDYSRGFLQTKNFISCWVDNKNKNFSTPKLTNFIKRYLIPYNSNIYLSDISQSNAGINPPINILPLEISKVVLTDGPYNIGDTVQFQIVITNPNSTINFPGVSITDVLPSGVTFDSADEGGTYNSGTGVITWNLDVDDSTTYYMNLYVVVNADGAIINADYRAIVPHYPDFSPVIGEPIAFASYYPTIISDLVTCFVGLDTTLVGGLSYNHVNPWLGRYPISSSGMENTGTSGSGFGADNGRINLTGINGKRSVYYGNTGINGGSNRFGYQSLDNNYDAPNFASTQQITIFVLFNIKGVNAYDNGTGKHCITSLRIDIEETSTPTTGLKIFYDSSYNLIIENNGNIGVNYLITNETLNIGDNYLLRATFDKSTGTASNQIRAELINLSTISTYTWGNHSIYVNTNNFINTSFSPTLGATGGYPYVVRSGADVNIGVLMYYKTAITSSTDIDEIQDWIKALYGLYGHP